MIRLDNRAWVVGGLAFVELATPTYPDAVAIIDAADLARVVDGNGRWRAEKPRGSTCLYVARWFGPRASRKDTYLHRFLLGPGDGVLVDHVNGDGLDNRRVNIRLATRAQNNANRRPNPRTLFKGVRPAAHGRWRAQISVENRARHLGTFDTAEEAALAYNVAARAAFGDFACLNGVAA